MTTGCTVITMNDTPPTTAPTLAYALNQLAAARGLDSVAAVARHVQAYTGCSLPSGEIIRQMLNGPYKPVRYNLDTVVRALGGNPADYVDLWNACPQRSRRRATDVSNQ